MSWFKTIKACVSQVENSTAVWSQGDKVHPLSKHVNPLDYAGLIVPEDPRFPPSDRGGKFSLPHANWKPEGWDSFNGIFADYSTYGNHGEYVHTTSSPTFLAPDGGAYAYFPPITSQENFIEAMTIPTWGTSFLPNTLTFWAKIRTSNLRPSSTQGIIGGNSTWHYLVLQPSGALTFMERDVAYSSTLRMTTGTSPSVLPTSLQNKNIWVRGVANMTTGSIAFAYSTDLAATYDNVTDWTSLGSATSSSPALALNVNRFFIGRLTATDGSNFQGRIYTAGVICDPDPQHGWTWKAELQDNISSVQDGINWFVRRSTALAGSPVTTIVRRPTLKFMESSGGSRFLIQNHTMLDFSSLDEFTIYNAFTTHRSQGTTRYIMSKSVGGSPPNIQWSQALNVHATHISTQMTLTNGTTFFGANGPAQGSGMPLLSTDIVAISTLKEGKLTHYVNNIAGTPVSVSGNFANTHNVAIGSAATGGIPIGMDWYGGGIFRRALNSDERAALQESLLS